MQVYDTPEAINQYRMRVLRSALKLEILGMKRRGQPVSKIIKEEFGLKGNKQKLLEQLDQLMKGN